MSFPEVVVIDIISFLDFVVLGLSAKELSIIYMMCEQNMTRIKLDNIWNCRAPQIFFESDTVVKNVEKELARAAKLKCTSCGLKGAALGCFAKTCRRTYHVPCASQIADCRWDSVSC